MTNEFNTIIESSLGGLGAGRTIAAVRVVDDTGGSANASPLQLRELVGVDHSLLTEQIVPGEFWLVNGAKKQVYCRTFILEGTVTSGDYALFQRLWGAITSIVSISGAVEGVHKIDGFAREYALGVSNIVLYKNKELSGTIDIMHRFGEELVVGSSAKITANVKYTR